MVKVDGQTIDDLILTGKNMKINIVIGVLALVVFTGCSKSTSGFYDVCMADGRQTKSQCKCVSNKLSDSMTPTEDKILGTLLTQPENWKSREGMTELASEMTLSLEQFKTAAESVTSKLSQASNQCESQADSGEISSGNVNLFKNIVLQSQNFSSVRSVAIDMYMDENRWPSRSEMNKTISEERHLSDGQYTSSYFISAEGRPVHSVKIISKVPGFTGKTVNFSPSSNEKPFKWECSSETIESKYLKWCL